PCCLQTLLSFPTRRSSDLITIFIILKRNALSLMKVHSGYYIIINKCHGGLFMNKNIKTLLNVLPIILIPLFTERKNIKEHPDIERLGRFSSNTYHNVKDKG